MTTPADNLTQIPNPPGPPNPDVGAVGTYPQVVRVSQSDKVVPASANQQPASLETRCETIRASLNALVSQFNLLDTWFLRRDGTSQKDAIAGLTGDLLANGKRILDLPAATTANEPVRQAEFLAATWGVTQPYKSAVAVFSSLGTFTVPADTGRILAIIIGGGGGGGSGLNGPSQSNQGGGGASGSALLCGFTVTPSSTLTLTPGAGGSAGSAGSSSVISIGSTVIAVVPGGLAGGNAAASLPGLGGVGAGNLSGFTLVSSTSLGNSPAYGQSGHDGIACPTSVNLGTSRPRGGTAPFAMQYGRGGDGGMASGGAGLSGTGGAVILIY